MNAAANVTPPLGVLSVVVPAHDEERTLPGCLNALERALVEVAHGNPLTVLRVVVVLDSCTDASAQVVRPFVRPAWARGVFATEIVEVAHAKVGAARGSGFERAIEWARAAGIDDTAHWIASTDADTLVPAHWLSVQVERARSGVDALVGTVEPGAGLSAREREAWLRRHDLAEGHPHVHGANLGVRAEAYVRVGGFAPLRLHEDVDLVDRLRAAPGITVEATDETRVVTSSRLVGRAVGGFATYLTTLREELC